MNISTITRSSQMFPLVGGQFTGAAVAAILALRRCISITTSRLAFGSRMGFQEVTNALDIERGGEPAFRAVDGDVISEGSHEWQRYDSRIGGWSAPSFFLTKHL